MVGSGRGVVALAAALVLNALRDSFVFFNSSTDVLEKRQLIEKFKVLRLI